ncbi:MAG: response regulator [Deltaproteobacteria bacterium]|nr:response regulator [Deltaproteobacteria bacterium]
MDPASPRAASDQPSGWRESVTRVLLVTSIVASLSATLVIVVTHDVSWRRHMLLTAGVVTALIALGALLLGRRAPRVQALLTVGTLLAASLAGYTWAGFSSGPAIVMLVAIVAAALLLGRRALVVTMLIGVAGVAVIGALAVRGVIAPPDPSDWFFDSPRAWLRTSFVALAAASVVGAVLVTTVGWLERAVERARREAELRAEADRMRLEADKAAAEARRVELIGRLASGVAHDFNNALQVIQMSAELARAAPDDREEVMAATRAILDASRDAASLTRQLLVLGRRDARQVRPLALAALVDAYRTTLARVLPGDIGLTVTHGDPVWVEADASQLHQVLLNLVVNARDALGARGSITLRTRVAQRSAPLASGGGGALQPGRYGVLEVEDDGPGMDAEVRARAFEPFFSTKGSLGTGLGLASIVAIAEQHRGGVTLDSAPGRGTRIALWLPARDAPAVADPATDVAGDGRRDQALAGLVILVAEDEPRVLDLIARALTRAGATVVRADDGDQALARIGSSARLDALCTDAVMPGAPVSQVIARFEERHPGRPVIVCSGHVEEELVRRGIEAGRLRILAKPFEPGRLVALVAESTAGPSGLAADTTV